jgi:glycosyltransferase involved in cell wall biosynthesis
MSTFALWSAQYAPHVGGVETYTQHLAEALTSRGHHVTVVTSALNNDCGVTVERGVEVVRLPSRALMGSRLPLRKRNREYRQLIQGLKSRAFDGVLVNTRFYGHSLEGMKFARSCGKVPVVLDHGSAYLTLGNPFFDAVIKAYEHAITWWGKVRYKPRYFGVSRRSSEWLQAFGITSEGELPNSIDAEKFRNKASARNFREEYGIQPDVRLVAFVGRLAPEKGIRQLAAAARLLKDEPLHFLAAGQGPLADEINREAPCNFTLVGSLESADVSALLQQSDIFCLPTRSEGFCTSLLEAGACSCAPVITQVGGTDELIPTSEYGIILEDASEEAIVRALANLLGKWPVGASCGMALQNRIETYYSWAKASIVVEDALMECKC